MTTQYQESNLAFLKRLLAEERHSCWFEQTSEEGDSLGQHRVDTAESNSSSWDFRSLARLLAEDCTYDFSY